MSAQIIPLSPAEEKEDIITPQEVMQMDSFRHLTEEQATELLQFFDALCDIAYSIWSKQQQKATSNIIPLIPPLQQSKAA